MVYYRFPSLLRLDRSVARFAKLVLYQPASPFFQPQSLDSVLDILVAAKVYFHICFSVGGTLSDRLYETSVYIASKYINCCLI